MADYRLNGMRSADCSCTRLGETEVQDFPLFDEILDRTRHIFDWHFAIYPVLVIEIDAVGLKALSEPSTTFLMCVGRLLRPPASRSKPNWLR